jgi:hypothetical protein
MEISCVVVKGDPEVLGQRQFRVALPLEIANAMVPSAVEMLSVHLPCWIVIIMAVPISFSGISVSL